MAWSPILGSMFQYDKAASAGSGPASGYVLKLYNAANSPIQMASLKDGTGLLSDCVLDSSGYPLNGSAARFTPFIDQEYKIALYSTQALADADTTGSSEWYEGPFDQPISNDSLVVANNLIIFETVAAMVASTDLNVGDHVRTLGYYAIGDGGGNDYDVVAAATGTDDQGLYIDLATHQALGLFCDGVWSVKRYGAYTDNTNAATTTAAFLNLYADLITNDDTRADFIIGTGHFALNANLPWTNRTGVFGAHNTEECVLIPSGTFDCITIDHSGNSSIGGFAIEGSGLTGMGVVVELYNIGRLHNVNVTGVSSHGCWWKGGNSSVIDNCQFINNGGSGFVIESFVGSNPINSSNALQLIALNVRGNTVHGLHIIEGDANYGYVIAQQNGDAGIAIDLGISNNLVCYLERNWIDSGTTTSTTSNKLVETGQNFNTTVTIGDRVINTTDATETTVSAIDSDTVLSLNDDIFTSGEDYIISNGELQMTLSSSLNKVEVMTVGHPLLLIDGGSNNTVWGQSGTVALSTPNIKPIKVLAAGVGRQLNINGGTARGANAGGILRLTGGDGDSTARGGHVQIVGGQAGSAGSEVGQVQIQTADSDITMGNAAGKTFIKGVLVEAQATESLTTGGAISITSQASRLTADTNPTLFTLANGTEGQIKKVLVINGAAGDCRITPASMFGNTFITLSGAGSSAVFEYRSNAWYVSASPTGVLT